MLDIGSEPAGLSCCYYYDALERSTEAVEHQNGGEEMRKVIDVLVFLMLVTSLISCASTRMTSHLNPERLDRQYSKILIGGFMYDFKDREILENKMKLELEWLGVQCLRWEELFYLGRDYSS